NRNNAGRLALNVLDRCAFFTDVGKRESYPAATLRQLQSVRLSTSDRLHVVVRTQQVARRWASTCSTTRVKEGWGCWLETTLDDVLNHTLSVVKVGRVCNSG